MGEYAENTSVSSEASRAEIERTLARFGCSRFMYGWEDGQAVVQFSVTDQEGRTSQMVRFVLPLPSRDEPEFVYTPRRGTERTRAAAEKAYEQAVRQRWRALALVIKAKLQAVQSGIVTMEEEFLAHTVLPDGSTVGAFMLPQVERAYETGQMPAMLPALGTGGR